MRCMYLDTETTGVCEPINILQFSYIIFDDTSNTVISSGNNFFLPNDVSISYDAYKVNALTEAYLYSKTSITFNQYIPTLVSLLNSVDTLVGHNIDFDLRCVKGYNDTYLNSIISSKIKVCTMKDYKRIFGIVIYDSDYGSLTIKFPKLMECYLQLLKSNTVTEDELHSEYKAIFPGKNVKFHDASWDTFVTYKVHRFAEVISSADKIQRS